MARRKGRSAKSCLAEVEKLLDYKYDWREPDFTSYDYDNGDAKDTIDRIAKALRKDKEIEE